MNTILHKGRLIGQLLKSRSGEVDKYKNLDSPELQPNILKVVECVHCGYAHLDPLPSKTDLEQLYAEDYYENVKPDYIDKDFKEQEYWDLTFRDRLKQLEKLTEGRELLDVGCGSGRFLKYLKNKGWNGVGVEPSKLACQQALADGLAVTNISVEDFFEETESAFDVICYKNVLEHVLEPEKHLDYCHKLLASNGVLYIEVPNDFDLLQMTCKCLLKSKCSWITKEHVSYFNFKSMSELLKKRGFKVLLRDTTFPMYLFPLLGINFIDNPSLGAKCHAMRMFFEMKLNSLGLNSVRLLFYKILAKLGMGRTVIIYARKI